MTKRDGGWLDVLATHLTLWVAAAAVAAVLHLATVRLLDLGFSVFRWEWGARDLVWKVPLGYFLVFAPVAAVVATAGSFAPRRMGVPFALWTWCALTLFSVLLLFPAIDGYASLLLAAGAAVPLSGALARRPGPTLAGARVVAALGASATLALSVALPRMREAAEGRAMAKLVAAPVGAPNVLLLILDTVRADYMSLYGSAFPTTPHLEEWGRRGVVFEESYSTSSWTTPSHASLFTGQFPSAHGASFTVPLAAEQRTIAEVLAAAGWATAGFTANYVATRRESGLSQGFHHFEDFKSSPEEIVKSTSITQSENVLAAWQAWQQGKGKRAVLKRFWNNSWAPHFIEVTHDDKTGEEVRESFVRWVSALPDGRPFFAFLNFFDAHAPYEPPEPYRAMFGGTKIVDRYRGGIRYIDEQIDRLLKALEQRGVLENTIVIVTSDHGEQFGEHGFTLHGNTLYRQVTHVPLLVMYPPLVPPGLRVRQQVTARDVPSSILALAGLPGDASIGGTSFVPAWSDADWRGSAVVLEVDRNPRPGQHFRNSDGAMTGVVNDTLHVIRDGRGIFEAYAYRSDTAEEHDLVEAAGDSRAARELLEEVATRYRLAWPRTATRR